VEISIQRELMDKRILIYAILSAGILFLIGAYHYALCKDITGLVIFTIAGVLFMLLAIISAHRTDM